MRLLASRPFLWSIVVVSALACLVLLNNFLFFAWLTAGPPVATPSGARPRTEVEIAAAGRAAYRTLAYFAALVLLGVSSAVRVVRLRRQEKAA
jgi:hypothetical protein